MKKNKRFEPIELTYEDGHKETIMYPTRREIRRRMLIMDIMVYALLPVLPFVGIYYDIKGRLMKKKSGRYEDEQ